MWISCQILIIYTWLNFCFLRNQIFLINLVSKFIIKSQSKYTHLIFLNFKASKMRYSLVVHGLFYNYRKHLFDKRWAYSYIRIDEKGYLESGIKRVDLDKCNVYFGMDTYYHREFPLILASNVYVGLLLCIESNTGSLWILFPDYITLK